MNIKRVIGQLFTIALAAGLSVGASLPVAWAQEPVAHQYSLKDAVLQAYATSSALKGQQASIDKAAKQRDDISNLVTTLPSAGLNANPADESVFTGSVKSSINWETAKKSLAEEKDSITLNVLTQYYNLITCQDTVQRDEDDLARDEQALSVQRAYSMAGLTTNAALLAAESKADASRKALEGAKAELAKAYIVFNQLVGLGPDDRPVLTDALAFTPVKVDNLDTEVERAVASSKDLWKLQQLVAIAQLTASFPYSLSATGQPVYTSADISMYDVDAAKQNLNVGTDAVRQNVRTLYCDIQEGEQQYDALQTALKAAQENTRVQKLMFDVGITTLDQVKQAEAQERDLANNILLLAYKHEVQVANFHLLTGDTVVKLD